MTNLGTNSSRLSPLHRRREFLVAGEALWLWWQQAKQQAIAHSIPASEAAWLLQALSNLERLDLWRGFSDRPVELEVSLEQLAQLWQQRIECRTPVQYLVGRTQWRQFCLRVAPAVLIPRPETELLIDLAVQAIDEDGANWEAAGRGKMLWADLGTGSGAIALGLAAAFPAAVVHAVDCSREALAIAATNAATYSLTNRICFHHGSWMEPLHHLLGQLSGIVANPPYIPSQQVLELQPEVAQHEPHLALDGGADGLNSIRHLVATAPAYLRPGGVWLIEMMAGQAEAVAALLRENGSYEQIQIHSDLAGVERFALARRR